MVSSGSAQAQSYRFTTVTVEGNQQIDDATIEGIARIARNRALSAADLNAAYQRVAGTGFFRTVDFAPSGSRLVIRVSEYPILNVVNFEGNRRIDDEAISAVVVSRSGRVYSPVQAEADATAIAELYSSRGRLAARITPRLIERSNGRVDLAFEILEGGVIEFQRISFVGNRTFSERRLRNVVNSAQAGRLSTFFQVDNYNEQRIANDHQTLEDFYRSRGFVDAQVLSAIAEVTRERDAAYVTFTIREGQQYRFGSTDVVSEIAGIDAAAYQDAINVRSGALFSPVTLDNQIQRIERVAYVAGQRFVRADPRLTRNERDGTIDVTFALVRADRVFIERIDIQGNATTQDNVIRRQFHVAEGDPLNPREIREAATRIRQLGYFSDVQAGAVPGSSPDQAVVDVRVEEQPTGSLGFGLSYGANDGLGGNITYSESNFLGRGQSLSLSISTISTAREFDLSFTDPAIMGRDLALGLRLGLSTSTASTTASFGTEVMQFSPSLSFPLSDNGRLTVRTTLMRDEITAPGTPAANSPRLQQDWAIGPVTTVSVGWGYNFDSRRSGDTSDSRYYFRFNQDLAGLGGDRRWLRTTGLVGYEQMVFNGDVTLRVEAEAGAAVHNSGASRINERFTLSNSQMRGFMPYGMGPVGYGAESALGANDGARNGLGGNFYAVARFEAEFPLPLPQEYGFNGGVFLDVGTLWGVDSPGAICPGGTTASCVVDDRAIRATAGVSLFWTSPIGPLRFNFSTPLQSEAYDNVQRFDFMISSRF